MTKQPLGEVFGFPIGNDSADANRYRTLKLCPYHNIVPNCTKDKASDPLGVCSIIDSNDLIITCPIRFREDWIIAELAPQLIYKGGILHDWNKKTAVALDRCFFETLPRFEEVDPSEAEMAWLVYDLILDPTSNRYRLTRHKAVYTKFVESLRKITEAKAGKMADFVRVLQTKLDTKLIAPNNNTIGGFQ